MHVFVLGDRTGCFYVRGFQNSVGSAFLFLCLLFEMLHLALPGLLVSLNEHEVLVGA